MRDSITTLINGIKAWIRGLLAGKLDKPGGGKDGDVLTKNGKTAEWQTIADAVKESFPGGIGYPGQRTIALTYSGNPDDYETVKITNNGVDMYLALIDSDVYAPEDFVGGSLTAVINGSEKSFAPITEDNIITIGDATNVANVFALAAAPGASFLGFTVDKPGVYVAFSIVSGSTETIVAKASLTNTISAPKKIAAEYLPGATLPPVTSADDGKILTVVDGKWVAAVAPTPQAEPEVSSNV